MFVKTLALASCLFLFSVGAQAQNPELTDAQKAQMAMINDILDEAQQKGSARNLDFEGARMEFPFMRTSSTSSMSMSNGEVVSETKIRLMGDGIVILKPQVSRRCPEGHSVAIPVSFDFHYDVDHESATKTKYDIAALQCQRNTVQQ